MKKLSVLILCLLVMILLSCIKKDFSDPGPSPSEGLPTKTIHVSLQLPSGFPISYADLKVLGVSEATAGTDGSCNVTGFKGYYDFIDIVDNKDNLVACTYGILDSNLVINESSTALGLIFKLSLPWESLTGMTRDVLIQRIKTNSKFSDLTGYVKNVMKADPHNLLNFDIHPLIIETIKSIVDDYIINQSLKSTNGAYIDRCDESPDEILIKNPKMVPFGISGFDLNGDPTWLDSYFLDKQPYAIPSKGLMGLLFSDPSSVKYKTGKGDFVLCFSKPDLMALNQSLISIGLSGFQEYTFAEAGAALFQKQTGVPHPLYQDIIQMDANMKAILANNCEIMILVVGAFPGVGGGASLVLDILYSMQNDPEAAKEIGGKIAEFATFEVLQKDIMYYLKSHPESLKWLAGAILHDRRMTKVVSDRIEHFLPFIPSFLEFMLKMYDWQNSDQYISYKIHKDGSQSECAQSLPPDFPTVTGVPSKVSFGSSVDITAVSHDPEGKNIQYQLWVNPYSVKTSGWLASGTPYTFSFTPSTTGVYNMSVYALDEDRAMSGPTKVSMTVASGQSVFSEGFESYTQGKFESNGIWDIEYTAPSEVLIVNKSEEGSQSAKFMDFDPAGDNTGGLYAYTVATIEGNPGKVEFSLQVENQEDVFGVRAWNVLGDWNTLAYYILIDNGKLEWVRYGYDPADPNDFVPIMDINPGAWYKVKLIIDWSGSTYSIYVNQQLVASNVPFVEGYSGGVTSAPYFQCVAFVETQCRAGLIDAIYMQGAKLISKKSSLAPDVVKSLAKMTSKR
ncbi:MAG: hypothetical protein NTX61_07285 [Bacteroidetes bacterium]|nr:hypothetical protein [Bacteroidota bacterium]